MIPTAPIQFWKYFDYITLTALFLVIGSLIKAHRRETGGLLGSISQTVAYSKKSSIIFSIAMTIFFPLYYAFIWLYIGPLTHAPKGFYYLLAFSALCEMTFVWVPATVGRGKRIHEVAAAVVGIAMFVLPLVILLTGTPVDKLATIGLVTFLITPFILISLLAFQGLRKYTFLYETIYCLAFLVSISLVAHG